MIKPFIRQSIFFTLIFAVLTATSGANALDNVSPFNSEQYGKLVTLKINKDSKVRGLQISKYTYMGQTKTAKKYSLNMVVSESSFVWGFNSRGLTIMKKF